MNQGFWLACVFMFVPLNNHEGSSAGAAPQGGASPARVPNGPLGERYRGGTFSGQVTEITKSTISVRQNGKQPFRFRLSPSLAKGELPACDPEPGPVPPARPEAYANVIADLQVGDMVDVEFSRWDQCDAFLIYRRPGGKVPPVRGESEPRESWVLRHHELMQMLQDREERGIPLPARYYGTDGIAPAPRVKVR